MTASARKLIRTLTLPYDSIRTLYEGDCEVRLYRNELTGDLQVGKRYDTLGLESTLVVNEGQLLKRIRHLHVVPVTDVVVPSGYAQPLAPVELIMPFFERGSLADAFLKGERFSVGEAVRLVSGALLGLAEIHECFHVLHRDVKSPNLFLTKDGRLLVGDLGVSISMDAEGRAEALPSPRLYCPPETFTARRVDRRSDIFQMGLVLHELTSGPFPYDDAAFSLEKMAERLEVGRPAVRPRHLQPSVVVPARLRRIINKATQVDPARRFRNAKAMLDALAAATFVDWCQVRNEPDRIRWEGATTHRADRIFAVEATRRRGGGWSLTGQQFVSTWRRTSALPDAICSDPSSPQAASFFDSMVDIATSA